MKWLIELLLGLLRLVLGLHKTAGQQDAATDPDLQDEWDELGDDLPPFNPT